MIQFRTLILVRDHFRKFDKYEAELPLTEKDFCKLHIQHSGNLDTLDIKILRWLLQGQTNLPLDPDFRKSYRVIARDLGVDEGTVRYRIRRFQETGFVRDWHVMPNPSLWGGGQAVVWLDVPPSVPKQDLIERLMLVPGVFYLTRYFGTLLEAFVIYDDERSMGVRAELIRRMSSADSVKFAKAPYPACRVALSSLDSRLVRSLSESPRKPYVVIAGELGVSSRTVKRRLLRLSREGVVFVFPTLNVTTLWGSVMAVLFLTYDRDRKEEIDLTLAAQLNPYLWHTFHLLSFGPSDVVPCMYNLMLPNVSVARELLRKAQELEGVREARVELVEELVVSTKPLEEMTRRIAESPSEGIK